MPLGFQLLGYVLLDVLVVGAFQPLVEGLRFFHLACRDESPVCVSLEVLALKFSIDFRYILSWLENGGQRTKATEFKAIVRPLTGSSRIGLAEDRVRLVESTPRAPSFSGLRVLLLEKPRSLGVDHRRSIYHRSLS